MASTKSHPEILQSLPLGQSAVCQEKVVVPANCFSFLGSHEHEDDDYKDKPRKNIDNYFFRVRH